MSVETVDLALSVFVTSMAVLALAVVLVWYGEPEADHASTQVREGARR